MDTLNIEQKVYDLLSTSRKLFHKDQKRVEFYQYWQQEQAFNDFEQVKQLLSEKNLIKIEKNKTLFILKSINKVITVNFKTILKSKYRKDRGWVEYSEADMI